MEPERIAKYLAHAGIASRRDIERMIAEGRITVNGKKLDTPATLVTEADAITVDGRPVGSKPTTRLWRYHKPAGLVTTAKDPQGRQTVFDTLPRGLGRVISVGRLDLNSEGLLLLTNNGELARHLELPSTGLERVYRVRVHGTVTADKLAKLAKGIKVDDVQYGPVIAVMEKDQQTSANLWLNVTLTEGKNREIRRVMEAIDLKVNRLIRQNYGPFELGPLKPGEGEEVPVATLKRMFSKVLGT